MPDPDSEELAAAAPERGPVRSFLRRHRIALRLVIYAGLVILLLRWFEHRMTFAPSREWQPSSLESHDAEEITFTSSDGLQLSGAWFPHPSPRGAIVYCHGNAGNLSHRVDLAVAWRHLLGYSVLLFDYRGYGKSKGSPSEAGLLIDSRAAFEEAQRRAGVVPVIAGRSLGTVPAILLATEVHTPALIIDSPMASARKMARAILPIPGIQWLVSMSLDNVTHIANVRAPILILHGDEDQIIPFEQGRLVFDAAPKPKQFVPLIGLGHNDDRTYGKSMTALQAFINSL